MRVIGHLDTESGARAFGDYLYVQGIDNQVEPDSNRSWAIWVHDDEHLAKAGDLLTQFRANPADGRYLAAAAEASRKRAQARKEQDDYQKRYHARGEVFRRFTAYGVGPLSLILVLFCCGVAFQSNLGENVRAIRALFISEYGMPQGSPLSRLSGLVEISHGQIWRIFTPIFIHFGFIHILFNMMWLLDLGSMIEGRQNTWILAALIVVIAGTSNVAQYAVTGSPLFGGMSGVVYGLLGYIWIRGRLDPGSGLYLHSSTVVMMIIWFFLCLFGLVGHVANTVHAVGLGVGLLWGYLSSLRWR